MSDPVEDLLRDTFRADATFSPLPGDLAGVARQTVRRNQTRHRFLAVTITVVAVVAGGVLTATGNLPLPHVSTTGSLANDSATDPPAVNLIGPTWHLTSFTENGATVDVPADATTTLRIDRENGFTATAGCNDLSGTATVRNAKHEVTFSLTLTTDVRCRGLEAQIYDVTTAAYLQTLTWAIHGLQLTLTAPNGETLTYAG
jgi:heat shock protein HslJ